MKILIAGDYIKDVVFLDENKTEMSLARETIKSGGLLDQNALVGIGGSTYVQETFQAIHEKFQTSRPLNYQSTPADNIVVKEQLSLTTKDEKQFYDPSSVIGTVNYWTIAKRPQSLSNSKKEVYRITDKPGKNDSPDKVSQPSLKLVKDWIPSIAIISDHDRSIRTNSNLWREQSWISRPTTIKVILLANTLPDSNSQAPLWEKLSSSAENKAKTIIVTSIDRLRQEGAKISQRLSWDATLQDFRAVLEKFPPMHILFNIGDHLVVRIGVVGAIYCYKNTKGKIKATFIYDPNADQQIFRDRSLQGNAFGIRSALPAYIAHHLARAYNDLGDPNEFRKSIIRGAKDSILLSQQIYNYGFGDSQDDVEKFITQPIERIKLFTTCIEQTQVIKDKDAGSKYILGKKWFPHVVEIPVNTKNWEILNHNLNGDKILSDKELIKLRRLRLARTIAFFGLDAAINNFESNNSTKNSSKNILQLEKDIDEKFREQLVGEISHQNNLLKEDLLTNSLYPLCAPVAAYGALRVLGKEDCESYNSIRNLLSNHIAADSGKPLSVAVFGQPGCGKSFGVKALAQALAKDVIEIYDCNVSQLHSQKDLDREFFKIGEILLRGKIPLVFFDEFDSTLGEQEHGWLKYFLSPMQDGLYRHDHGYIELKNSIFIFAGGIYSSYEQFSSPNITKKTPAEKKELEKEWKKAKVYDFVSRLHGHINIGGINGWDDQTRNNRDPHYIHLVRRGIILRSFIERDKKLLNEEGIAQIDKNIIDAFLRVKKYKHGARSIGAVLKMCSRWNHRIEKSSLPDEAQLAMHVNAEHFMRLALNS